MKSLTSPSPHPFKTTALQRAAQMHTWASMNLLSRMLYN